MRLYTVEVSYEMVVYATDEEDALEVARDHAIDGVRDICSYDLDMDVRKYPEQGMPYGYKDDCWVYGGEGKSIRELVSTS